MAVDSRWWLWVAGVPIVAVFWLLTVVWLAIAAGGTGLLATPVASAVGLATIVLGIPMFVVAVVFPMAVYYDARALSTGGLRLQPAPRLALLAAASLLTGPVLSVPFACWYLWRRHRVAGVP
ncbi:MAG: hypothetical protein ABEJ35_04035 [Halobacteriaceae archaeon]